MSLIEVKNLSLGYNGKTVLKNISFSVEEGDFLCVVGPNGAGKTTLIRGLLGIIEPSKGEIKFDSLKPTEIGYMPQETAVDSNFPATVKEIVSSGALNKMKWRPFYSKSCKEGIISRLKLLGIENLAEQSFSELSGGQRQKVLLARSLVATSKLLILDEPSNNLDSKSKKDLYRMVQKINKDNGITVIMITHDLDHGNLIGNKILSLRDKVFFGTTDEFVREIHDE